MLIKVCGMRDPDNISRLSALDIHWMGFIFYGASKRFTEYVTELEKVVANAVRQEGK